MELKAKGPLRHIHHAAYRCRDAEQTRWFWEDVMGFPLKMAFAFEKDPATNLPYEYMHLFFEMGDGGFVAFFDAPDDAREEMFEPRGGYDVHVAFECEGDQELEAWRERVLAKGVPCGEPIDHDFVRSIYLYDPNGLQVEVTTKSERWDEIVAHESREAEHAVAAWTRKSRARKQQAFGEGRVDQRNELCEENLKKIVEQMLQGAKVTEAAS